MYAFQEGGDKHKFVMACAIVFSHRIASFDGTSLEEKGAFIAQLGQMFEEIVDVLPRKEEPSKSLEFLENTWKLLKQTFPRLCSSIVDVKNEIDEVLKLFEKISGKDALSPLVHPLILLKQYLGLMPSPEESQATMQYNPTEDLLTIRIPKALGVGLPFKIGMFLSTQIKDSLFKRALLASLLQCFTEPRYPHQAN